MGKAIFPFLRVPAAQELFVGRQPLIGKQSFVSFANLCCPARSAVDDLGSGGDKLVLTTALVLFV